MEFRQIINVNQVLFSQLALQTEMEGFVSINVGFKSKLEQLIVIEAWEVQTVINGKNFDINFLRCILRFVFCTSQTDPQKLALSSKI